MRPLLLPDLPGEPGFLVGSTATLGLNVPVYDTAARSHKFKNAAKCGERHLRTLSDPLILARKVKPSLRPRGPMRARTREKGPCGPEQSFFVGGHVDFCNVVGAVAAFRKEEILPMSSNVTPLQTPLPQTIEKHGQDGFRYKAEFPLYGLELRGYGELNCVCSGRWGPVTFFHSRSDVFNAGRCISY